MNIEHQQVLRDFNEWRERLASSGPDLSIEAFIRERDADDSEHRIATAVNVLRNAIEYLTDGSVIGEALRILTADDYYEEVRNIAGPTRLERTW